MAQSSALRREVESPQPQIITINNNLDPNPQNAQIPNDGSVELNAGRACWLYFSPVGVFGDPSTGLLELNPGPNGPFYPQQQNVTVSYCVTDPNTTCNPAPVAENVASISGSKLPATGGNTIHVG
jgi:hypothetical protein